MGYSKEISGLLIAVAGIALVQFGFSENCSNEIVAKVSPLLGALPGIAIAWIARVGRGDISYGGFRK